MRARRLVALSVVLGAAVACSYASTGGGGSPEGHEGKDSGATPAEDANDGTPDTGSQGSDANDDATCGPGTCQGCCFAGQCVAEAPPSLCGLGGVACRPCDEDSGHAVDSGEDSGEVDAESDAEHDAESDAEGDAGHDAGHDAGADAGHDAGHDAGTDAGHDAGLAFGAKCTASAQCGAGYPACEAVPGFTDGGMMCTKTCTKPTQEAGCPKPPTNGVCAAVGYCE